MPKPVGGTLVFAVNSLFYLNQGIPIYGVSLNATGDKDVTTDILIRPLEGVKVSLDCAIEQVDSQLSGKIKVSGPLQSMLNCV